MERVVVDTSLAIKWLFPEDQSDVAVALLQLWLRLGVEPLVPSWFMCEFANVVYQRLKKDPLTLHEAQFRLREMVRFVRVVDFDPDVSVRGLEIAFQLQWHASYDPHYLAMAEYLDCECWTADYAFWRAVSPTFPMIRWFGEFAEPVTATPT